jgi:hypothetical protein
MSKKNENKWLQIGNYLLGVDTNAHGSYVVLKSVAQNWSVRWREDTMMFASMLNIMKQAAENENVKEYLHSLITVMFITTSYMHDLVALSTKQQMPFCEVVAKLLKEQNDYEQSLAEKKPTKKEDEEALKEVVEMREVEEELEKLDEEAK